MIDIDCVAIWRAVVVQVIADLTTDNYKFTEQSRKYKIFNTITYTCYFRSSRCFLMQNFKVKEVKICFSKPTEKQ